MKKKKSLTIFFPVHNEIANIEHLVRQGVTLMQELSSDPEIIIVDDGSSDGSGDLCDRLAQEIDIVRVIHHSQNQGYGAALQSGFRGATKELVFYTDGDGQFKLEELKEILPLAETADVVSCYRQNRQDPWHRILNTRLFEWAIFIVFGLRIKDPDCAFKIYRREVLDSINMISHGAMIDVEMLLRAQRKKFKIVQHPVTHLPRRFGKASGADLRVIFRALTETYKLWRMVGGRFFPRI